MILFVNALAYNQAIIGFQEKGHVKIYHIKIYTIYLMLREFHHHMTECKLHQQKIKNAIIVKGNRISCSP